MDRVLIRKSDGVPIEYQSGQAVLGSLKQNAVNAGMDENDLEEKYISREDYRNLFKTKVLDIEETARESKKNTSKSKIKSKLNLTDSDLEDLKEALK